MTGKKLNLIAKCLYCFIIVFVLSSCDTPGKVLIKVPGEKLSGDPIVFPVDSSNLDIILKELDKIATENNLKPEKKMTTEVKSDWVQTYSGENFLMHVFYLKNTDTVVVRFTDTLTKSERNPASKKLEDEIKKQFSEMLGKKFVE